MRLRLQTILTFLVALACTLLADFIVVSLWTRNRLDSDRRELVVGLNLIHSRFASQTLARLNYAVDSEARALETLTYGYSAWDDVYDYVRFQSMATWMENFSDGAMRTMDVSLLVLSDSDGRVLVGRMVPPEGPAAGRNLTDRELAAFRKGGGLFPQQPGEKTTGVIVHEGIPLLAAAQPITPSNGEGPVRGVLVFGRYLDPAWQDGLAAALQVPFALVRRDDPAVPSSARTALAFEGGDSVWYQDLTPLPAGVSGLTDTLGPRLLYGTLGAELPPRLLLIRSALENDLLAEEQSMLDRQDQTLRIIALLFYVGVLFSSLAMVAPFLFMLERSISRPVRLMEAATRRIAHDTDEAPGLPVAGADELKDISVAVNHMLGVLAARRNDLLLANQALDASLLPVIVTDRDENITMVNQAFVRMYGYPASAVVGKNPRLLNAGLSTYADAGIQADEYRRLFDGMKAALRDDGRQYWEGMLFNRCADGTVIPCQVIISGIRGETGLVGHVGWTIDLSKRLRAEQEVRIGVYQALSDLAERRDNETGLHLRRLGLASAELASLLNLSPHFVEEIRTFAPLHDIGKVGIQDSILLAPHRLDQDEFQVMKSHTYIGYTILAGKKTMEMAADIAWAHHEKWDGSGYPRGLRGEAIPLAARIVAVADVYDALRSHRPYKDGWSHEAALEYIGRAGGSHFDPEIAALFAAHHERFRQLFDENL